MDDLRDEVHEIPVYAIGQHELQAVQLLHGGEVGAAHADDDDGQRLQGRLHQGLLGGLHVVDLAVRDDEQHRVLLLGLAVRKGDVILQIAVTVV